MTPPTTRRAAALAATLALALSVAGCDLRFETPAPTAPEPGPGEVIRDHAAARSAELAGAGASAAARAESPVAELTRVAEESAAHLVALGGVYVPFPEEPGSPEGPVVEVAAVEVSPADVLQGLAAAAIATRGDADAVTDGPLARLLASVATAQALATEDLAGVLGRDDLAAPAAVVIPQTAPAGVPGSVLAALVASQDGLGYAWEVMAARTSDETRAAAAERGAVLRDRAHAWTQVAGLAEPGVDPRRVAYDLPEALTASTGDPAADLAAAREALGALEADLAELFATAVAAAEPGARLPLLDGMLDAARTGARTGDRDPFPGLPER